MKLARKTGSTSQIFQIFIQDSSSVTGAGLTGLTNGSSGLTAYYHRDTDTTATAISLVTMTVGTFTSSGFKEIDSANMPGWYQFCPPNAALAAGAASCAIHLKGVTNMAPLPIEVDLGAQVDVVSVGGTTQTARDLGASVLLSSGTGTGQVSLSSGTVTTGTIATDAISSAAVSAGAVTKIQSGLATPTNITAGTITTTTNLTNLPSIPNNWLTAAGIASGALTSVWDEVNTGATHNVTNSTGKQLRTLTASTDAIYPLTGTVNLTAATSTTATLDVLASAVSQAYQWDVLNILSGTGAGQSRIITNYTTGRVATVSPAYTTTPDATSTFDITPTASVQVVGYTAGQDPATLVWAAATRTLTAGTNIVLAKGTGITGFNDIAATAIVTGGAITTSSGSVSTVTTTTNLTNLPTAPTDWLTAAAVKADAVTKIQAGLSTYAGGAVASVTGNVGGNVTGTVGGMTAAGMALFFTTNTTKVYADAVSGSVVKEIASNASGSGTVDANIVQILGQTALATQQGLLDVRLAEVDGAAGPVAHAGTPGSSTATFALSQFNVTCASGNAVTFQSGDAAGMLVQGFNGALTIYCDDTNTYMRIGNSGVCMLLNGDDGTLGLNIARGLQVRASTGGAAVDIQGDLLGVKIDGGNGPGVKVQASAGNKAVLLTGDAATDALAIAVGAGSPIDIFDAAGRVLGRFDATGLAEFFSIDSGTTYSSAVNGSVVKEIATHASGGSSLTAADVWAYSARTITGLTAAALATFFAVDTTKVFADAITGSVVKEMAGGSGSDLLAVQVPGSYAAGSVGYIIGNRIDVSVSSRSTYAGTDTPGTLTLLSRIGGAITINGGAVAIDWAHVVNPTSTVALTNTTISATQAVASVTGNVGGTIGGLTAAALAQFFTVNTTKTYTDAISGSVVKEIAANSSGGGTSTLTAADVWGYGTRTLTSLGATAPAGWIDAASIASHALDGKGDWSTYAGGDTSGVTTLLSRIGGTITITSGAVNLNMAQPFSMTNTPGTVGDAFNAARAQGFGNWVIDVASRTLIIYGYDTTTVVHTFDLDNVTAPLRRS